MRLRRVHHIRRGKQPPERGRGRETAAPRHENAPCTFEVKKTLAPLIDWYGRLERRSGSRGQVPAERENPSRDQWIVCPSQRTPPRSPHRAGTR